MINLTFASFKVNKEPSTRLQVAKKPDQPITSFKALGELKEPEKSLLLSKRLDNQENTLTNISNAQQLPRKNYIKVQTKSSKKTAAKTILYKSPLRRPLDHIYTQTKNLQQSNYCTKSYTQRQEEPQTMTPSIAKNARSFAVQDNSLNRCFLTQKQKTITDSENGSVESCKNSFNESFNLGTNDEEFQGNCEVVNSLQLQRDPTDGKNDLSQQPSLKSMKKSMHFFCTDYGNAPKQNEDKSVCGSVTSAASIKFSQKFKHYKKKQTFRTENGSSFSLKDFKLMGEIGSGKYGKVSLAMHKATGFICALKSVSKRIIREQKLQIPFMREVKIQLYLNHPNIVKLYGIFHDYENVYLVMEYCSESHLYNVIKQRKQFTETQILAILSNIYQAVSYIHSNGVIHRDIKPENVVIEHGIYKLCDFGWAAYACGDPRTTFCGTPLYVCPEVLKGEEYNEKADIWGLGIVTYELTFGRVPFSIMNQGDLMKIIKDQVYFPIWGQASQKLIPWVRKMLSKHPEERPSLDEILSSQLFGSFNPVPNEVIKRELVGLY